MAVNAAKNQVTFMGPKTLYWWTDFFSNWTEAYLARQQTRLRDKAPGLVGSHINVWISKENHLI